MGIVDSQRNFAESQRSSPTFAYITHDTEASTRHKHRITDARTVVSGRARLVRRRRATDARPATVEASTEMRSARTVVVLPEPLEPRMPKVLPFDSLLERFDQNLIATRFGVTDGRVFHKWLVGLGVIRNHCAH